jgi:hypothetical protein
VSALPEPVPSGVIRISVDGFVFSPGQWRCQLRKCFFNMGKWGFQRRPCGSDADPNLVFHAAFYLIQSLLSHCLYFTHSSCDSFRNLYFMDRPGIAPFQLLAIPFPGNRRVSRLTLFNRERHCKVTDTSDMQS